MLRILLAHVATGSREFFALREATGAPASMPGGFMNPENLIEIKHLTKDFESRQKLLKKFRLRAVNNVSFDIRKGETFGLVGESGSGKSTLGRLILGVYKPTAGEIIYSARHMQIIFQDPYSSLNPHMNITQIVAEPLFGYGSKSERETLVAEMLKKVGLSPDDRLKYPKEFSGGQRQRISIARALIVKPDFLFCDEPISSLDISIGAQIVNLLQDLQAEFGLTYLFVAHDLSMVRYISHRAAVMYNGEIVELNDTGALYDDPKHPYTKTLLAANPRIRGIYG
jgi:ABC-type oligopeptide transport system ATPase subunit